MSRSDAAPAAILANRVSKRFLLRHNPVGSVKDRVLGLVSPRHREVAEPFWALHDISLAIAPGEAVGLVGRNGSGKSTFLKLVAGILSPTGGQVFVRRGSQIGTMIELGIGFHLELTAVENVYLNAAIHGLPREVIADLLPAIVDYSGLANFMDVPLKNFSSGMYMRLGFAVAANLKPDVLLIDEVFAVGDADFQERCMTTMQRFRERGCTIIFVSHATAAVRAVCSRVVAFEAGGLVFDGGVDEGLSHYARLMAAGAGLALPGADGRAAPVADPGARAHRAAMAADWEALGPWAVDFLRRQGLTADRFVLDLGCGSLPVALHLLPLMAPARYWGVDADRALFDAGVRAELLAAGVLPDRGHFIIHDAFDLSGCPYGFDLALAHSLARRVPPEAFARALAAALIQLAPGGRLFVAVPDGFDAHRDAMRRTAATAGVPCEPVDDAGHPAGDSVFVITRVPGGLATGARRA